MRIGLVSFTGGCAGPADDPLSAFDGLADGLVDAGHEVTLIERRQDPRQASSDETGVRTRKLVAGPTKQLSESTVLEYVGIFVRRLSRELAVGGYDVVHSHGWLGGLAAQLAVPVGSAPLVHTFHQSRLFDSAGGDSGARSRLRVERSCAARADQLVTTSTLERDALVKAGLSRPGVTVIPPGVSVDPQATGVPDQRGTRMVGFGLPSRLVDLVRTLPTLPGTELVVCGTAGNPSSEAGTLVELATRLGVARRLHLADARSTASRRTLLRGARLAIFPGPPAGVGTEHLEAMACGVPVLAGDPVVAEAVADGITGRHVLQLTPPELAKLLRDLLSNRITCQQMGLSARDRAATRYRWPRIADEHLRVYQTLLPQPSALRLGCEHPPAPADTIACIPLAGVPGQPGSRQATGWRPE